MNITSRPLVAATSFLALAVLTACGSMSPAKLTAACDASSAGNKQIFRYQADYIFYKAI